MCPDRQILSLYLDEELPSPWKEKMEIHLDSCGKCQTYLNRYKKINIILNEDKAADSTEHINKVWDKLIAENPDEIFNFTGNRREKFNRAKGIEAFWNRTVSLPFPVAAAAAAAVLIIFTFLIIQGIQPSVQDRNAPGIAAGIGTDVQGMIPVSDMNTILQYLSGDDMADYMIIRLPETRSFYSSGEPAFLKAADYSRRNSSR